MSKQTILAKKTKKSNYKLGYERQIKSVIPPQDRETQIDFTLDTVLNDLIKQGHMNPAKSYMFKTQEMKEHIGRMCDRVRLRKFGIPPPEPVDSAANPPAETSKDAEAAAENQGSKAGETKPEMATTLVTLGASAKPIVSIMKQIDKSAQAQVRIASPEILAKPKKSAPKSKKRSSRSTSRARKQKSKSKAGSPSRKPSQDDPMLKIDPAEQQVPVKRPVAIVPEGEIFPRLTEESEKAQAEAAKAVRAEGRQVFKAVVDLRGFADNHISLEMDKRRLIIIAQRPPNDKLKLHARKAIEVIQIPDEIDVNNLTIGRGLDGTVVLQEYYGV